MVMVVVVGGDKEWETRGVARWRTAAGVQAETVGARTQKSQLVRACGKVQDADALSAWRAMGPQS